MLSCYCHVQLLDCPSICHLPFFHFLYVAALLHALCLFSFPDTPALLCCFLGHYFNFIFCMLQLLCMLCACSLVLILLLVLLVFWLCGISTRFLNRWWGFFPPRVKEPLALFFGALASFFLGLFRTRGDASRRVWTRLDVFGSDLVGASHQSKRKLT